MHMYVNPYNTAAGGLPIPLEQGKKQGGCKGKPKPFEMLPKAAG